MWKIVVIEDENKIREGFILLLESLGLNLKVVGEAQTSEEAMKAIYENKPHVVFVDIEIPGMNGLSLIEKTQERHSYLPIIVSGYDYFEYMQKSIRLNVFDYLLKPVGIADLEQTLLRAIAELEKISINNQFQKSSYYDATKNLDLNCNNNEVNKIIQFIKDNYSEDISTQDAANYLGISPPTLNKILSEANLDTFSQILLDYRMQKSLYFIMEGQLLNYEVGRQVGYPEYKYFSHIFKKYFGCSINELRDKVSIKIPT